MLDVRGDHGFGTAFANKFLVKIAKIRTLGHEEERYRYASRSKFLRFGKRKIRGTLATHFKLGNSAVFREFYLANSTQKQAEGGGALCDIAFLDLDPRDGVFVAIENKLFTTNRQNQLELYFSLIEVKYKRATVLEYVYLTLTGEPPVFHEGSHNRSGAKAWVRMSWIGDILDILDEMPRNGNRDVSQLRQVLAWLRAAYRATNGTKGEIAVGQLFKNMVAAGTECIVAELKRLNEGARGKWHIIREGQKRARIVHSSKPTVPLFVEIMSNLSIAIFSRRGKKALYDKLLIPFGSNPDQVFNLMDFAARDIFALHFGDNYKAYLGPQRRLTVSRVPVRTVSRVLFRFVHEHRNEVLLLAAVVRRGGVEGVVE